MLDFYYLNVLVNAHTICSILICLFVMLLVLVFLHKIWLHQLNKAVDSVIIYISVALILSIIGYIFTPSKSILWQKYEEALNKQIEQQIQLDLLKRNQQ